MEVQLFNTMSDFYKEEADKIVQQRPSAAEVAKPQKRGTFTMNPPSATAQPNGQRKQHRNGTFVIDPKENDFKNAPPGISYI
jgi:hypothetical protein